MVIQKILSDDGPGIIFIFFILYAVYQVLLALYRAFWHPLAKFPGPRLAGATRLPVLRMYWAGTQPYDLAKLHEGYGPVVRVSPNELSFNTAQAWRDIYGHRTDGRTSFVKDPRHYGPTIPGESHIINTNDEDHSRVRRILAHSFSDKALKEQETLLQRWAGVLVKQLGKQCEGQGGSAKVDLVSWYNFTTFDIMADLTFAEPLYMLEGSSYTPWVKAIFGSIKIASRMRVISEIPVIGTTLRFLLAPIIKRKEREHHAYTDERVDRRMAREPEQPDLWSHILQRKEKTPGSLSLAEMHSNARIFMIAGTETTATLLSGLTYLLLVNPDKLATLVHEIRAFDTDLELTVESLAKLRYLNACIEEGLRCYPAVPTGLPRIVPARGAIINGEHVPGGTVVSVDQWSTYSSPNNFSRPREFIPERWMADAPEEFLKDDKKAFNPFSYGPRNCLGRNLAYHETRLLLTKLLYNFDLELVHPDLEWNKQKVFFLWDKPQLMVRLTPVNKKT